MRVESVYFVHVLYPFLANLRCEPLKCMKYQDLGNEISQHYQENVFKKPRRKAFSTHNLHNVATLTLSVSRGLFKKTAIAGK